MRVLFLSQYYRNRKRDEEIKKLVEGRNPIQREKWNLILGSVALGYLLYCCSTQKKKKKKASTFIVLDATVKTLHILVLLVFTKT